MNRKASLAMPHRRAFGIIIEGAREAAGLTYQGLAESVEDQLHKLADAAGRPRLEGPSWTWFQHLAAGPPRPLANVVWLDATLHVLGLTWADALDALGASSAHNRTTQTEATQCRNTP